MKKRTAKRALKWIGITIGVLLIIIAAGAMAKLRNIWFRS